MRYLAIITIIIVASVLGYYAGQYFYKEKTISQNETFKPLISPLIEEKKYDTTLENTKPLVIIPSIQKNNEEGNQVNNIQNKQTSDTIQNSKNHQTTVIVTRNNNSSETVGTTNNYSNETFDSTNKTADSITPEGTTLKSLDTTNSTSSLDNKDGQYYIQIGSFSSLENAQLIKNQLESIGLNPTIEQIISGGTTVYRVIIGYYKTEKDALEDSIKLKKMGFDNVIKSY